jgi:beta-lactamase regulating signal transducer with metallopeptidase domain
VIAAMCLLAYALLLLTIGASGLARAGWVDRAPRLAIAAWLALSSSAIGSMMLGGLALVVPTAGVSYHLADLLAACAHDVRARYAHPGGAALAAAGAVLTLAVTARVCWCTARMLAAARRDGRRHCHQLRAIGRTDQRLGAVVVDYGEPAAYSLPGARQPIVLTSAAIEALDDAQLTAVLAHERAHQRGHHHLLVLVASSLAAAFPRVPAFRHGHELVTHLVELLADDAAARTSSRLKAAEALLALSAPAPAAPLALAAGGSATGARIRRLLHASAPLSRPRAMAGTAALAAVLAFPFLALSGPAVTLIGTHCIDAASSARHSAPGSPA